MKTPIQELISEFESEIQRAEQNENFELKRILQVAKDLAELKLEKEKEVMQEFAWRAVRDSEINLERGIEKCWEKTFNTKEK